MQISLLSGVKNSFDSIADIDRFSADIDRSHAVIDQSSGTKHLEALGSIRLPKVISVLILYMDLHTCSYILRNVKLQILINYYFPREHPLVVTIMGETVHLKG